jgi:TetR/AcrR family transcriptional regulator, fatty acid metabolism regulator protein
MVFYGAIEQLLTGWIFGSIPGTDADFERAKQLVVETICDGLEPRLVSDAVAS